MSGLLLSNLPKMIDRKTLVMADKRIKPIKTPTMNLIFNRDVGAIESDHITREFLSYDVTVKKLVAEGASQAEKFNNMTYSLDQKTIPLFKMTDSVKATDVREINNSIASQSNFEEAKLTSFEKWFANRYEIAFRHLAMTRENIAAQSVSGSISHTVIAEDNTTETFQLTLGTVTDITSAITITGDWQNSSTTLFQILKDTEISFNYFRDNIDWTARKDNSAICLHPADYYAVKAKAQNGQTIDNVKYSLLEDVGQSMFSIDGWVFILEEFKYKSGSDFSVDSNALPAKKAQWINLENLHRFRYLKYENFNNPSYKAQAGSTLRMYTLTEMGGVPAGELMNMYFISRFMPLFNTNASCLVQINP